MTTFLKADILTFALLNLITMRVFVTGASGFVGSAVVKELLGAGHQVLGLVRSEINAGKVRDAGAEALLGDINDVSVLKKGVEACDAVIHTAFNHDFTTFKQNCEDDRKIIEYLGNILLGTGKPMVMTSAIGLLRADRAVTEDDVAVVSEAIPRAASEQEVLNAVAKGVKAYIVRLPPTTHGAGDYGFIPIVIGIDKEKGKSAYIGEGTNRWPAVHRFDSARLYRLIIEQKPAQTTFHAVAEEGIDFKVIAQTISNGTGLPLVSVSAGEAQAHFTWFTHFAMLNCPASAEKTKTILGWQPTHATLIKDMEEHYF